ncbi:hypothetical protein [Streptomyces sp. NBC_00568]|uniref:hypothetical protein n=1 Tax=Streptomyces sp. NBC_00568 TaxID=2975779 RepID=UPI00225A7EBC|nr:hypothetical protein [Streptomyces sp. NBC_00568]MCX4993605.1 hypothetical protein [Streptomyces sp. NBC_00568]
MTVLDGRSESPAVRGAAERPDRPRAVNEPYLLLPPEVKRLVTQELPAAAAALASVGGTVAENGDLVLQRGAAVSALSAELHSTQGISIQRGTAVTELLTGTNRSPGTPHVRGVLTNSGEAVLGDLIVDAAGRHSAMVKMLGEIGALRPLEEWQDSGSRLYTRHFRPESGTNTWPRWSLRHFAGIRTAVISDGSGMWSVALEIDDADTDLYPLAGPSAWHRAARMYEAAPPRWEGIPWPGVWVTPRVENCYRRFVLNGRPVASGTVSIGDAWAATDPILGLGLSMGVLQALFLRDAARWSADVEDIAIQVDRLTETSLTPVYDRVTQWEDRRRVRDSAGPEQASSTADAADLVDDLDAGPSISARNLLTRLAAAETRGTVTTRTGPSRAELLRTLTSATATV